MIRYAAYLFAIAALLTGPGPLIGLIALGGAGYLHRPYGRLLPLLGGLSVSDVILAIALVPLIRLVGDVAKMLGYPAGVWWRWRNGDAIR